MAPSTRLRLRPRREPRALPPAAVLPTLAALVAASALAATAFGPVGVPIGHVLRVLTGRALPGQVDREIILDIRLPQVAMAALVGAALAVSGAVLQGLFKNPLASPGLLGVSAGAGFAAVAAIGLGWATASLWTLPLWAFLGALAAAAAVYLIASRHGRAPMLTLILSGVAVSSLFAAGTTAVLTLTALDQQTREMLNWLFGGLDGMLWRQDAAVAPIVLCGGAAMCLFARELNLLAAGDEGAAALGVAVEPVRRILLALCALVTGAAVAFAGPIAFVGLMVPHMLRLVVGADHRLLLPASLLGGAAFVILCNLLAQTVARPAEINLGVVTAFFGVPFFLYLLRRAARGG